jgi:antitoxin component of MazEF toxin-antitoxin module
MRPTNRRKYELKALLDQINSRNLHRAVDTGEAVGRESW